MLRKFNTCLDYIYIYGWLQLFRDTKCCQKNMANKILKPA